MKKVISLVLLLSTLLGMCSVFASCKKKPGSGTGTNSGNGEKYVFEHTETVIVDFSNTANIPSNLNVVAGEKGSSNGGTITLDSPKEVKFTPVSNISNGMEFVFWMKSTSSENVMASFYVYSDNVETSDDDNYFTTFKVRPGWNEYRIPFSELTEAGKPYGWDSVQEIKFILNGTGAVTFESFRINSQKYGSLKGQNYDKLANAVCFYEDCGLYYYNQFRKSMCPTDETIAVKSDDDSTYVPISVLAEHRGATDIVSSKEKVSFTYNGTAYEFAAGASVEIVGHMSGFRPGRNLSLKTLVSGDHVLVPMEKCAEIFGYELFYDQMGLVIFSDIKDIYISGAEYDTLYKLIEDLAYNLRTGEEMIRNMNTLHPENAHPRIGASQADFDRLKSLIKTDPTYKAWFTRYSSTYSKDNPNSVYYDSTGFYETSDGYRLLMMSREVMERIKALAMMYKLTDDKDYATRVYKELYALTTFTDPVSKKKSWQPECFLSTGEIMYAYAMGYDWCYDALSDEERGILEEAVWELGYGAAFGWGEFYDWWNWVDPNDPTVTNLTKYEAEMSEELGKPYVHVKYTPSRQYDEATKTFKISGNGGFMFKGGVEGVHKRNGVWRNNWNAVCNGGMAWIALAFANVEHPVNDYHYWSAELLDCIQASFPYGLKPSYGPDGGYPEGPGYWSYGTTYSMIYFSALQSATGSTNGMFNNPGFGESFYYQCSIGSIGKGIWGYHDAGNGSVDTALFTAYAALTGDTNIGAFRYDAVTNRTYTIQSWDLLYYDPSLYEGSVDMKLDSCYNGIQTVTFRSAWDENAMFCGLHGGYNAASHGQLDIGNFILEYAGTRFFVDLGSDEYNLVGYGKYDKNGLQVDRVTYFTSPYRYWYYRMRAEGHNTLIVNPQNVNINDTSNAANAYGRNYDQLYAVTSQILGFESGTTSAYAVVDMGCAYLDAKEGKRGLLVCNDRSTVIVQDEVTFKKDSKVFWMGHLEKDCQYTVSEDRQSAVITLDGLSLLCTIIVPEGAEYTPKFSIVPATYLIEAGLKDPKTETGFKTQAGEYDREGYYKLVATTEGVTDYKMAVAFQLLSDGACNYTWTPISEWNSFID